MGKRRLPGNHASRGRFARSFPGARGAGGGGGGDDEGVETEGEFAAETKAFEEELRRVREQQKEQRKRRRRGEGEDGANAAEDGDGDEDVDEDAPDEDEAEREARLWAQIQAERKGRGGGKPGAVVRDSAALASLTKDLRLADFAESLQVVVPASEGGNAPAQVADAEEDKDREMAFAAVALRAVKSARAKLDELKIPHVRPTDFMATMLKSDEHMARIKRKLLVERKAMEVVEQRKSARRYKLRSKQVKVQQQEEKAKRKRDAAQIADEFRAKKGAREDRQGLRSGSSSSQQKSRFGKERFGSGANYGKKKRLSAVPKRMGKAKRQSSFGRRP